MSGNLGGTFYGEDASEAAGSFAFDLGTGFSAGLWAAGENYVETEDGDYPVIVSYSNPNGDITDRVDQGIGEIPELGDNLILTIDGTATTVTSVSNVQAGDYSYTSMGQWTGGAPSSPINTGYWVAGVATPTSGLDTKTGSATFAGNIIGDYIPPNIGRNDVVREDASGTIKLTANFSQDQITGEMQLVSAFNASEVIPLESSISRTGFFFQSSDGNENDLGYGYGFSGFFFGPDGTELGGSVWAATNEGSYNGVFRAGADLTFDGFVTRGFEEEAPTDYSNYRGLAAYLAFDVDDASFPVTTDVVALDTINSTPTAFFKDTSVTVNFEEFDTLGRDYSFTRWGNWNGDRSDLVDGVAGRDNTAAFVIYDPTTDLRTTGEATYNGEATGYASDRQDVSGTIQLTADFANDRVTGNMSLVGSSRQPWADASFDTTIRRGTDSSGFQGALTGSGVSSGVIFGGFAGADADEVGGGWQIDNANGSDGVGVFRAHN